MFNAFIQAFKTPDVRRKLVFTLFIMALFRAGSFVPLPGVSFTNVQYCVQQSEQGGLLDLMNLFSGGALLQLSVFALGIMPYITASIITQLLRVVIPRFEDLHKEGQTGQAVLTQYTRYLTIALGVLQSTTIITAGRTGALFGGTCDRQIIPDQSVWTFVLQIMVMTAATGLIMWMGELITEKGIGNGMSLLIFTSIIASMPTNLWGVAQSNDGLKKAALVLALILLVTLAVVFVEQSTRRIPVQYAKRMVGRRLYGGTSTYIPLKINMSGVIPVIFSSSILALPQMIAGFADREKPWVQWIQSNFAQTSWVYMVVYGLLTFAFAFFYTSITFNPDEVADNMKKYGGFIPGIRAGKPTAEYLRYTMSRITTAGATYLTIVALLPQIAMTAMGITSMPFGGTTILIVVGVGLQTVKEINAQLQQHHYEGFLK
ncbi:MAG: preprotein translocase subunit SecY [Actinomycetaceae bacterium]|nr:preprotein translocase subunit SecY [Actinomycetaceae bacterium]